MKTYTMICNDRFKEVMKGKKRGDEYIQLLDEPKTFNGIGSIDNLAVIRITASESTTEKWLTEFNTQFVEGDWKGAITLGTDDYNGDISPEGLEFSEILFGKNKVEAVKYGKVLYRNVGKRNFVPAVETVL